MVAPSTIALPERYHVEHRIASGGMASVWAAHDEVLRRRVAVKLLSPMFGADESYRARFAREARAAARISDCGHVVTIYDVGEHDGRTFIVMEYFGGGTVADRMQGPGLVARDVALRWLRETATALDVAQAHGIVHRDVKPANLLLDDDGRLAITDFGIAHLADATRELTAIGEVVGTAAYLSPEQALGRAVTAASDRYALAVVAFELLCGERPYLAEHPAARARQHVEAPVPRITDRAPQLPGALDAVLARGLAKDPAERPATAARLVDELGRALREPTAPATHVTRRIARPATRPQPAAAPRSPRTPPAAPAPVPRARRKRRVLGPALLVVVALAAAGAIVALLLPGADEKPTRGAAATTTTPRAQRTATTPSPPADTRSPAELNDAGFALLQQGRYAEAVPLLRRAVEGFRTQGDTASLSYAYTLYNLASALARTGDESAAVPLLQERLRVSDDQRGVVLRELRRVLGG